MRKLDRICHEKLKELLLKTQDKILFKNSPFDMKVLAQKYVEKNSKRDEKNWL